HGGRRLSIHRAALVGPREARREPLQERHGLYGARRGAAKGAGGDEGRGVDSVEPLCPWRGQTKKPAGKTGGLLFSNTCAVTSAAARSSQSALAGPRPRTRVCRR